MQLRKLSRKVHLVLALLVGGLAFHTAAQAIVSVGLVPNALIFNYNLAAGGISGPLTIPVVNRGCNLKGVCFTVGDRGIGEVAIARFSTAPAFLMWSGLHSDTAAAPSAASIAQGFNGGVGSLIMNIDFASQVRVEVASASQVRVRNIAGSARAGNLVLFF
jgi:hypothetical protein